MPLSELIESKISVMLSKISLVKSEASGEEDCVRGTWKDVMTVTKRAILVHQ